MSVLMHRPIMRPTIAPLHSQDGRSGVSSLPAGPSASTTRRLSIDSVPDDALRHRVLSFDILLPMISSALPLVNRISKNKLIYFPNLLLEEKGKKTGKENGTVLFAPLLEENGTVLFAPLLPADFQISKFIHPRQPA